MKNDISQIIAEAVRVLRDGGTILYPTDTIWGIGCDATCEPAVEKVFALKGRPESKSPLLLASDLDMVARYVRQIPSIAIDLVEVNDAPMTIVYPGAQMLPPCVVAEDGSVGIRIPLNDFCRELVRKLRHPIVSTSANLSGEPAPASFGQIPDKIKQGVDYCVPAFIGAGASGKPSQIIKLEVDGTVKVIR